MKVVIDVPGQMQADVRYYLKMSEVTFEEVSGSGRVKFEMAQSDTVENALVGLWAGWADNPDFQVSTLTIKAN